MRDVVKTGSEKVAGDPVWLDREVQKFAESERKEPGCPGKAKAPQKSGVHSTCVWKTKPHWCPGIPCLQDVLCRALEAGGTARSPPEPRVLPARPEGAAVPAPHGPATGPGTPPAPSPHRIASSRSRSSSPSSGRSPPAPRRACCGCRAPGPSPLGGRAAAAAGPWLRGPCPVPALCPHCGPSAAHGAARPGTAAAGSVALRPLLFSRRASSSPGRCPHRLSQPGRARCREKSPRHGRRSPAGSERCFLLRLTSGPGPRCKSDFPFHDWLLLQPGCHITSFTCRKRGLCSGGCAELARPGWVRGGSGARQSRGPGHSAAGSVPRVTTEGL